MKKIHIKDDIYVLVDEEDYEKLSKFKWFLNKGKNTNYAKNKKIGSMHRFLMKPFPGQVVDHINGNGLDNRKNNLRLASLSENRRNSIKTSSKTTSKYKGVSLNKCGKWKSQIRKDGKLVYLGLYPSEEIAALAYNEKASELFEDFANLNDLPFSFEETQEILKKLKEGEYKPKFSSKYEGVTYLKREKCFLAYINENKLQFPLGYFNTEEEASVIVQNYYDSKIDSELMKTKALHYWRFVRKYNVCATEVGKYNSDVLVSNGSSIIETEIKLSKQDLVKEFSKPKHENYLSDNVNKFKNIPNKYYILTTPEFKEIAIDLLQDTPYGLLITNGKKVNNKRKKTFLTVEKQATYLTKKFCSELEKKIYLRMSSELVQGYIKKFSDK
jgi:hypothetical protein